MAQKIRDLAVKTGEYQDRQTGKTKGRYENVGAIMQGDNGSFIMLKRTFSPAGVINPDNRDSVLISIFEPRDQQQAPQQANQQPQGNAYRQQSQGNVYQDSSQVAGGPVDDLDQDIPFAPVDWRLS